ncbi:MAG: hypothetical protein K6G11_05220 [Lachnospiraceae bacterium]|nr:hypothetical protein [Lachnospiraceae bacterium]
MKLIGHSFIRKKFLKMLVGGTISMLVVSLVLMSDSIIAGTILGEVAVGAIEIVLPVYSFAAFVGLLFSIGIPIIYSKEMGKSNKKEADRAFGFGLLMTVGVGIVIFAVLMFFGDYYVDYYNLSDDLRDATIQYFFWMKFSVLFLPISTYVGQMVFTDGDEFTSTLGNVVSAVGNIVLSIVLCKIIGITGIGLASFIATLASLFIAVTHFFKKTNSLELNLYFSKEMLFRVISYSSIDSATYLFLALLSTTINKFVLVFFGHEYLILVTVLVFSKELQLFFDGIGEAMTPLISIYLGEKSYEGVANIYKIGFKVSIYEGIFLNVILIPLAWVVPKILGITGAKMINLAIIGFVILTFSLTFLSLLFYLTSYYLLIKKIVFGFVVSGMRDFLVVAPMTIIFSLLFGIYGMFIGFALSPAVTYFLTVFIAKKKYGADDYPLFLKDKRKGSTNYVFEYLLQPKSISNRSNEIRKVLELEGYSLSVINKVILIFEEVNMMIIERNKEIRKEKRHLKHIRDLEAIESNESRNQKGSGNSGNDKDSGEGKNVSKSEKRFDSTDKVDDIYSADKFYAGVINHITIRKMRALKLKNAYLRKYKRLLGECSIVIEGDNLKLILRDDGEIMDITQTDQIGSFRDYFVTNLLEMDGINKIYMMTMSYNRNIFNISLSE